MNSSIGQWGNSLAVSLPKHILNSEGLLVNGKVMCDQLRSPDFRARKYGVIYNCPELLFQDVLRRIKPMLF